MKYDFLSKAALFRGFSPERMDALVASLPHRVKHFAKEETVLHSGSCTKELGILLSGGVRMESLDVLGNRAILGFSGKGEVFAESYACIPGTPLMVDVVANEDSAILFLDVQQLLEKRDLDPAHSQILRNLLRIAAIKNQRLSMRIFHSSPKTIRMRLLSYFSELAKRQGSRDLVLPMDRQQLADYLNVERSALSKEIGKMKKEQLIEARKSHVRLLTWDTDAIPLS